MKRLQEGYILKVFLVEDESIVREGLRDRIEWGRFGFEFAGEAGDGEMALPLIRKIKPDLILTDIKMPFMDGLSLSKIVSAELPDTKIVIISGYDDFEYAREAIGVGAMEYLLKPITRSAMTKLLPRIREKIESERNGRMENERLREELQEYEQYSRRNFLERLFEGHLSVQEIYEQSQELGINLDGSAYNIILYTIQGRKEKGENENRTLAEKQQELAGYFMRFPEYLFFVWNLNTCGVLLKGEPEEMDRIRDKCLEKISRSLEDTDDELIWYVAVGNTVERLSLLTECYHQVNHIMSYSFFKPAVHILNDYRAETEDIEIKKNTAEELQREKENGSYSYSIKKALNYIEENFAKDDISLNEVAACAGVSTNYFSSAFRQEVGETFTEYLTSMRLKRATELLVKENLHTAEVAARVGYKDSHYFSSVFKRKLGYTPREYRNRFSDIK